MKPYVCLNFLERCGPEGGNKPRSICHLCLQPKSAHIDFDRDWKPPPIDDEYLEKRSIELVKLKGD